MGYLQEKNAKRAGSRQQNIFFLFSILVSLSVFTYLLSTVSVQEITDIVKKISIKGFAVFIIFSLTMSLFRTWRYTLLLNNSGFKTNSMAMYLITIVRNFFSDLLPARLGTLIYIYLVKTRLRVPFGPATASFALSFVFDMLALAFLIVISALLVSSAYLSQQLVLFSGIVLALGSGLVLFFLPSFFGLFTKMVSSLRFISLKHHNHWRQALDSIREDILKARRANIYFKLLALSLAVRCFKYLSLYVLLLAMVVPAGYQAVSFPLSRVFLGLCSAEFAASLPVSGLAGFGAYEGAWSLVFQLLGYPERLAVVTSIAHHLITQVYGYSLGAFALLILLLPFFRNSDKKTWVGKQTTGLFFMLRFAGFFCLPLLFSLLFVYGGELPKQDLFSLIVNEQHAADVAETENHEDAAEIVQGWVVYERPDGIYRVKVGRHEPEHLLGYGSYPRWSADGKMIVFVHNNAIMVMSSQGNRVRRVAVARKAKAVCFHPNGDSIFYTDGNEIRQANIADGSVRVVIAGPEFLELDIADDGKKMVVTTRTSFGFRVRTYDMTAGKFRTVARGCSASISPDGDLITVNGSKHRVLTLYSWDDLQQVGSISAPSGYRFDNQFWSNHPDWIAGKSEGEAEDIFIHQVSVDKSFQVTFQGNCDRPDFLVQSTVLP